MNLVELEQRIQVIENVLSIFPLPIRNFGWPRTLGWQLERPARDFSPSTHWVWYPKGDGTLGVGSVDRWFSEDAHFPDEDALANWLWARVAQEYISHWIPWDKRSGIPPVIDTWRQLEAVTRTDDFVGNLTLSTSGGDPSLESLYLLASNPTTRGWRLNRLVRHPNRAIRWAAAGNSSLPDATVMTLIANADFGMRWHLAAGHPLPAELLQEWAWDDASIQFVHRR